MKEKIAIFWFRRDLRLSDNVGLFNALQSNYPVLPIFIFDTNILEKLTDKTDKRVNFIFKTLKELNETLIKNGRSLVVKQGKPLEVWEKLLTEYEIKEVYTNHDYEPYAIQRDEEVKKLLAKNEIDFFTYKDQVVFEKKEVLSNQGTVYTVYTPFKNKWKETLLNNPIKEFPSQDFLSKLVKLEPQAFPSLEKLGFEEISFEYPSKTLDLEMLRAYAEKRDFPSINATSRFGLHLRFGTVSIRKLVAIAQDTSEIWLSELIWREFFMMILANFPHVVTSAFKPAYNKIVWNNNEQDFQAWCKGETGYPIVDAGMRELNETGLMHNRVRMITASFLVKHLLIDWKWGEKYFAEKLLDFDLSANNGNWQWVAGSGCDAAPYFRVFNPETQTTKFDKDLKYIKKWLPEFGTSKYVKPIVEHTFARERVLQAYKIALAKDV